MCARVRPRHLGRDDGGVLARILCVWCVGVVVVVVGVVGVVGVLSRVRESERGV